MTTIAIRRPAMTALAVVALSVALAGCHWPGGGGPDPVLVVTVVSPQPTKLHPDVGNPWEGELVVQVANPTATSFAAGEVSASLLGFSGLSATSSSTCSGGLPANGTCGFTIKLTVPQSTLPGTTFDFTVQVTAGDLSGSTAASAQTAVPEED